MAEKNFVIQVRVNQKWSTAHGLSSEKNLRKFLPQLVAEHGDIIRALRASRDTRTGKTKWSVYRYSETDRSDSITPLRKASRPYASGMAVTNNVIELREHFQVRYSNIEDGSAEYLQETQYAQETENWQVRDSLYEEDNGENAQPEEQIKTSRRFRFPRYKVDVRKWFLAPLASGLVFSAIFIKTWIAFPLARGIKFCAILIKNRVLVPLMNGIKALFRMLRRLAAEENKIERLWSLAVRTMDRLSGFIQNPLTQWASCALLIAAGLFATFAATVPGGLTAAVMAGYCAPPIRRYLLAQTDQIFSAAIKSALVFILLVVSGTVELASPARREINRNIYEFREHREEVIANAQSSLADEDYLAVVTQLSRFLPAENEEVNILYTHARPFADQILAREAKINAQFSFNGSNKHLTDYIIRTMSDPGSYQHVKTSYRVKGDYLEVETTYRGLNEFGMLFTKTVRVLIDLDGRVIHER